jgi:hypothetical protein
VKAASRIDVAESVLAGEQVDETRRRKKEQKRREDSTRPLDEWELYRALVDASDEAYELIDIANREARFALILMGALNAVPLVMISRADAVAMLSVGEQYVTGALALGYAALVLTFILRAIDALKPGRFRPEINDWPGDSIDRPAGIRYYEDVVRRSATEHWATWRSVRLSQVNAELAVQVHSLALKNDAKHISLRRLYAGLRVMALALAFLSALFVFLIWT